MELSVTFAGQRKTSIKLKNYNRDYRKNIKRGLNNAGRWLQGAVKTNLKASNPVKLRKSPYKDLRSRTGFLRRSINVKMLNGGTGVKIGPNVAYAKIHEFGGKAGRNRSVTIPKRPYFWPMVDKHWDKMIDLIGDEIYKPIRTH